MLVAGQGDLLKYPDFFMFCGEKGDVGRPMVEGALEGVGPKETQSGSGEGFGLMIYLNFSGQKIEG